MGKGKRTRLEKQQATEQQKQEDLHRRQKNRKRNLRALLITAVCVITAGAVTTASLLIAHYTSDGYRLQNTVAMTSSNYELSSAEVSYCLYSTYENFVASNSDSLASLGLDTTVSLKEQNNPQTSDTWFNYFADTAKSDLTDMLILCESALEAGISLTQTELEEIQEQVDTLRDEAEAQKKSLKRYLRDTFGDGVDEAVVRRIHELRALATKYSTEAIAVFTYDEEEIKTYYQNHISDYLFCDFKSYTFTVSDTLDADTAKARANELAASSSAKEFDARLTEYLKTQSMSDAEIEETLEATLQTGYEYENDSDFGRWAFEAGRVAGDTLSFGDEGGYAACFMVNAAYRKQDPTKDVRHILFKTDTYGSAEAAKTEAERVLAEWQAGEKTEDSFVQLAMTYSEDSNAQRGGIYENVKSGRMVASFNDWCFDQARQPGDTSVIETTYGAHVMYFVGEGLAEWQADVVDALRLEDYNALLEERTNKFPVTIDPDAVDAIAG